MSSDAKERTMKKRLMALLLLTGLLSAALTGCGGGSTEQASEDGQTADGSTEALSLIHI